MRTYPLHEARAEFSKLVDRALAGEPQRVTRYGKDAVVVVSETAWKNRSKRWATLADLLIDHGERVGFNEELFVRDWFTEDRPLGSDFLGDE